MTYTIRSYLHDDTSTFTHLLTDVATGRCAVIDPVLDYDQKAGRTSYTSVETILQDIRHDGLTCDYVLETHAHADHLTSAAYIRKQTGARIVIGGLITRVQSTFADIFNEDSSFATDGSQFDILLNEGESLMLGATEISVIATPGHTPACVSYIVEGKDVFVGDTLFMPDVGTARCDFPGGDAGTLYDSIQRLLTMDDDVVLHLCHDYPPEARELQSAVTVKEQRRHNIHVGEDHSREDFIRMRTERDAGLDMPRLILPSLQINIRAGDLPTPENNGFSYLKVPLNRL